MSSNVKNRGPPSEEFSIVVLYMNIQTICKGLLLMIVLMLTSCKADIQKLYNDSDTLELEFESCIPEVDEFVYQPLKGSKPLFNYSKKRNRVVLNLLDACRRSYTCHDVEYNSSRSDQNQLCLQNDKYRFVIQNSGSQYIMHMYFNNFRDWILIASFTQNEDDNVIEPVEFKDLLKAQPKDTPKNEDDSDETFEEPHWDTYEVVSGNSHDGYVSIRESKSSRSKELGRLANDEYASHLATEDDWYKIKKDDIVGYVYSKYAKKETMIDP